MKSHAMKARAEAEAQSQHQSTESAQKLQVGESQFQPVKPEIVLNGSGNETVTGLNSTSLGPLNLSPSAAAAVTVLRPWLQQQQMAAALNATTPMLLRNILQHVCLLSFRLFRT